MIYAVAGSIMGVGEIVLLPLDVLKIKAQTNPESLQGRGVFKILKDEGMGLYRCVRAGVGRVCVYVCIILWIPYITEHARTYITCQHDDSGATWTAARNAPGSFALFGGSALVKDQVFKVRLGLLALLLFSSLLFRLMLM